MVVQVSWWEFVNHGLTKKGEPATVKMGPS